MFSIINLPFYKAIKGTVLFPMCNQITMFFQNLSLKSKPVISHNFDYFPIATY